MPPVPEIALHLPKGIWTGRECGWHLKAFKSPATTQRLPYHFTSTVPHLSYPISSKPIAMIFSTTLVVYVLSLFTFTSAATIPTRKDGCTFVCPDKDLDGDALFNSTVGDAVTSCSYVGKSFKLCAFNSVSLVPPTHRQPRLTLRFRPAEHS